MGLHVHLVFVRPLVDWTDTTPRFIEMVFQALENKIRLSPSEFSAVGGGSLGDLRAKYAIYGGGTSVTLQSDKLAFDFPNLIQTDLTTVADIMRSIHDAFPSAFPEVSYNKIDVQSYEHLELENNAAVATFLNRYALPGLADAFGEPTVTYPGVRFTVAAADQRWECVFSVDRSLLSPAAVFAALQLSLREVDNASPYDEKAARVTKFANACYKLVGLEDAKRVI